MIILKKLSNNERLIPIFKKLYDLSLLLYEKETIDDLENLSILK